MANVLVTGAAGFLGSHLCERLMRNGHRVVGVDSLIGADTDNLPLGVKFLHYDCCDMLALWEKAEPPDVVYHLAAAPHEGLSVFSPYVVTRNTYLSSVAVAAMAARWGVKRVVFASSMSRYGRGLGYGIAFTEKDMPRPVDPYGIAKVASEDVLRVLGKQHGFEVVNLVPHNIYGTRQRYTDPFRNVVAIFVNLMLQGRAPTIYGDGEQLRCFSYVSDVIEPFVRAGFQDGLDGETINVGPDEGAVTINELFGLLCDLLDFKKPPDHAPARPCEVKTAWCSADKSRRLLGYKTKTGLKDGLRKTIDWIKAGGTRPFVYHLPIEIPNGKGLPATWKERKY